MSTATEISAIVGFDTTDARTKLSTFNAKQKLLKSNLMSMLSAAQLVLSTAVMFEMVMYRNSMMHDIEANRAIYLRDAQMRYVDTVNQYGPNSEQAIRAGSQLTMVRNQEAIMQQRVKLMQEQQINMFMGAGIGGFTQLAQMYQNWGSANDEVAMQREANQAKWAAKNEALMEIRTARLAEVSAEAAASTAAEVFTAGTSQAVSAPISEAETQAEIEAEQQIMAMHAGGVVGTSGYKYLEAGETISSMRGMGEPHVYNIILKPIPGTPTKEIARAFFASVERIQRGY